MANEVTRGDVLAAILEHVNPERVSRHPSDGIVMAGVGQAADAILALFAAHRDAESAMGEIESLRDQVRALTEERDAHHRAGQELQTAIVGHLEGKAALRARAESAERARDEARAALPSEAVKQFHAAFGVALGGSWVIKGRRRLRRELIREEFWEYREAEDADNPAATLDALVDLTYVIVGAALEYGWDFDAAFAAVHAANMAKLGPDGKPIMRGDGKVLKPEGWRPADLTPYLTPTKAPSDG